MLICKKCGFSMATEEEEGRFYCPNCKKYQDFFEVEEEEGEE